MRTLLLALLSIILALPRPALAQIERGDPIPSGAARPYGTVYVLTAGWNEYPNANDIYEDLRFAKNDADVLGDLLASKFEYQVEKLPDDCDRRRLIEKLDWYEGHIRPDDVFIMYIASHGESLRVVSAQGFEDEAGYIVLPGANLKAHFDKALEAEKKGRADALARFYEANPNAKELPEEEQVKLGLDRSLLEGEAAARDVARRAALRPEVYNAECMLTTDLRDRVMRIPAKHTLLIVDACYSGFATRSTRNALRVYDKVKHRDVARYALLLGRSKTVLTAGSKDQKAIEWDGSPDFPNHGLYTGALINELQNAKGAIAVGEVYDAVRSRVMTLTKRGSRVGMTPRRHPFDEDDKDLSEFVFIPKPTEEWFKRVAAEDQTALLRRARGQLQASARSARDRAEMAMLVAATVSPTADGADRSADPRWWRWFDENHARALAGDSNAMVSMYFAYSKGLGVERDPRRAYEWSLEAQKSGNQTGAAALAQALSQGVGVSKQEFVARQMEREAAANKQAGASALVVLASAKGGSGAGTAVGLAGLAASLLSLGGDDLDKATTDLLEAQMELSRQARLPRSPQRDKAVKELANKARWAAERAAKHNRGTGIDDVFTRLLPDLRNDVLTTVSEIERDVTNGGAGLNALAPRLEELSDSILALLEYRRRQLESAKQ